MGPRHSTRQWFSIPPIDYLSYVPFKASIEFMLLAWNGGEMLDARRAHEARNGESSGA
jgi:hypothetical protein